MLSEAHSHTDTPCSTTNIKMLSIIPWGPSYRRRKNTDSRSTTLTCRSMVYWDLSMGTPSPIPIHWRYGRHNLGILLMAPKSSSIITYPRGSRSGASNQVSWWCSLMVWMGRVLNIVPLGWRGSFNSWMMIPTSITNQPNRLDPRSWTPTCRLWCVRMPPTTSMCWGGSCVVNSENLSSCSTVRDYWSQIKYTFICHIFN